MLIVLCLSQGPHSVSTTSENRKLLSKLTKMMTFCITASAASSSNPQPAASEHRRRHLLRRVGRVCCLLISGGPLPAFAVGPKFLKSTTAYHDKSNAYHNRNVIPHTGQTSHYNSYYDWTPVLSTFPDLNSIFRASLVPCVFWKHGRGVYHAESNQ